MHKCAICPKSYSTRIKLKRHQKKHEVTLKTYTCKLCAFTCTTRDELYMHMKEALSAHMTSHSGKFKCRICPQTFDSKSFLNWHESMHDTVGLPYDCIKCGHRFKQSSNLKRHVRAHDDERKFQCVMCASRFSQLSNLQVHSRNIHEKKDNGSLP